MKLTSRPPNILYLRFLARKCLGETEPWHNKLTLSLKALRYKDITMVNAYVDDYGAINEVSVTMRDGRELKWT